MPKVGETVMAPRPGTKMKMGTAKIVTINKSVANVQFENGVAIHQVKVSEIQPMPKEEKKRRQSRSPGRSRARTRSSSRSRPNASRSRSRSKSRERLLAAKATAAAASPMSLRSRPSTTRTINLAYNSISGNGEQPLMSSFVSAESAQVASTTRVVSPVQEPDVTRPQPETHFGGPFGAFIIMIGVPLLVLAVNLYQMKKIDTVDYWKRLQVKDFYDPQAIAIFFGWLLAQALLFLLPIGRVVNGSRLKYRCNGFLALILTVSALGGAMYYYDWPVDVVLDKMAPLMATSIVFSFLFSFVIYLKARRAPCHALAPYGNSGNVVYDFFAGHELNPRIGNFDIKTFLELRPGLIAWVVINLLLLWKQYSLNEHISHTLLLTAVGQIFYAIDALYFEEAMLNTLDIMTEGLGFMLIFGNLSFVPFVFTLQSRCLYKSNVVLPWYYLAALAALNVIGYLIYHSSNTQKVEFRKNPYQPALMRLETIKTGTPKEILAGGWWGFVRHPNYLGDLMMAWSWCLAAGFNDWVPYTYAVYLTVLLLHRAVRDDAVCRRKYGAAWDGYCNSVKSRVFYGVF